MLASVIIKILLNVVLISTFIGIFFFTYETKIEESIVEIQSKEIIQGLFGDFKKVLPPTAMQAVYDIISPKLVAPDMSSEDDYVKKSNKALIKKATKIMASFTIIGLALLIGAAIIFKVPMKDIAISSVATLVFVAIIEYIFLTFMVQHYKTIDANFVKYRILRTLANY